MLTLSILLLLSSNAVSMRRDKSVLYARIVIAILICCFLLCITSYYSKFIDTGIGLFGGLYHLTSITNIFTVFIFVITSLIVQLNGFYPRKISMENFSTFTNLLANKFVYFNKFVINKMSEQFRILEYPLIILFVVLGGIFLISSCDLISIFLAIELQSYGLYILCAVYRNSERAASGSLTYFLLGGLSSCFILLGSSLIYSNSGNTSFDGLYIINNISNSGEYINNFSLNSIIWYESYYIYFSLVILSVGFLFKISAAPFHFWSPDVYDAIPTVVTTFVAVFAKISIFILLLELVHYTTNFLSFSTKQLYDVQRDLFFGYSWTFSLLISSVLSLIIGAVLGLTQFRVKRLYAYSTITHIGFMLLALTVNSIESVQSFLFYLMQYSLSNLNAFLLLIAIGSSLYFYVEKKHKNNKSNEYLSESLSDKNNSPIQIIDQLKGYFQINSTLSISLSVTLFSFIGIPPLVGFFAKQMVLSSALDNGYIFIVLVAILTSVVSAYYYLALIKQIFFFSTDYVFNSVIKDFMLKGNVVNTIRSNESKDIDTSINNVSLSSSLSITISALTLIILLFILIPQEWLTMANILALILFNC